MESTIRHAMNKHLTENMLIKRSQHCFLQDRSCTTNLLKFLEEATKVVDFDVVYLEFAKALDKMPKERLLKKNSGTLNTRTCPGLDQQLAQW
jgi:hypothetical protein